jgi:hypothetical protein
MNKRKIYWNICVVRGPKSSVAGQEIKVTAAPTKQMLGAVHSVMDSEQRVDDDAHRIVVVNSEPREGDNRVVMVFEFDRADIEWHLIEAHSPHQAPTKTDGMIAARNVMVGDRILFNKKVRTVSSVNVHEDRVSIGFTGMRYSPAVFAPHFEFEITRR